MAWLAPVELDIEEGRNVPLQGEFVKANDGCRIANDWRRETASRDERREDKFGSEPRTSGVASSVIVNGDQ